MRSRPAVLSLVALVSLLTVPAASAATAPGRVTIHQGSVTVGPGGGTPGTAKNFVLVGHDALFGRG